VTSKFWPATVIVAERGVVVLLAVMLYVTVPLPTPAAPFVIVIQLAPAAVVQAHPAIVLTAIVLVEADGPSEATVGEIA
jgi:hypothetical protein